MKNDLMKRQSLILILFFTCTFSFAQTQNKTADTVTVKYKLSEYLLSCQSMAYTIIGEKDFQTKSYLGTKGLDYYNKAYQQFVKLQDPQYGELNEELRKSISTLLEGYAKIYGDISLLNDPSYAVALAFMDNIYKKKILPGLWDKK